MPLYSFDVKLFATIEVEGPSEACARRTLEERLGAAESANLGCWEDGQPIVAPFSTDGEADLIEIDGAAV